MMTRTMKIILQDIWIIFQQHESKVKYLDILSLTIMKEAHLTY